jgi:hypothetical protein
MITIEYLRDPQPRFRTAVGLVRRMSGCGRVADSVGNRAGGTVLRTPARARRIGKPLAASTRLGALI